MTLRSQLEGSLSVRLSPGIRSLFAGCGNSSVLGTGHTHGEENARPQVLTGSARESSCKGVALCACVMSKPRCSEKESPSAPRAHDAQSCVPHIPGGGGLEKDGDTPRVNET